MKHVPYFRFYPSDFMAGVRGMSAQEVGVYTMLLCLIYEAGGPVENNPLRLATYCGMRMPTFERTCEKLIALGKITAADGWLSNARAEVEIAKRADDLKIAFRAGKASAEKRQQNQAKPSTDVQRTFNHTDTDTDKEDSVAKATGGDAAGADLFGEPDLAKVMFDQAVAYLGRHGVKTSSARAFVGKLRKAHPDHAIIAAMTDCAKAGVVDPVPWISARMAQPQTPTNQAKGNQNERRAFDQATAAVADRLSAGTVTLDHSSRDPFAVRSGRDTQADQYGVIPLFRS